MVKREVANLNNTSLASTVALTMVQALEQQLVSYVGGANPADPSARWSELGSLALPETNSRHQVRIRDCNDVGGKLAKGVR